MPHVTTAIVVIDLVNFKRAALVFCTRIIKARVSNERKTTGVVRQKSFFCKALLRQMEYLAIFIFYDNVSNGETS